MPLSSDNIEFPEFKNFVTKSGLINKKGAVAIQIARILGQGSTRAKGLNLRPANIERQEELLRFSFPLAPKITPELQAELDKARKDYNESENILRNPDLRRRFALKVLQTLNKSSGIKTGNQDGHFFAGRFVLVPEKNGKNWSWSMTPHYPIISKIPADDEYIVLAHTEALNIVKKWFMPTVRFEQTLSLAWKIANHFNKNGDILIADVARLFKIAAQSDKFWLNPLRSKFEEVPEAVFVYNLINWHRDRKSVEKSNFQLVPATLNQALGPRAKPYYVPANSEGTAVKPMIHIRRSNS